MLDLKDLLNQRGKAVHDARAIVDKAEAEKRDMNETEQAQYEQYMSDARDLTKKIDQEKELREQERQIAETTAQTLEQRGELGNSPNNPDEKRAETLIQELRSFMQSGVVGKELRALQADADVSGGFLVLPEQYIAQLLKDIDDEVFVRKLATKYQVTGAASLGVPYLTTDLSDSDWTAEVAAVSEDTSMALGKRQLTPHQLTKLVKISLKLLNKSAIPAENLVRQRLAYKFGITEEKAFLTGTGAQQPLGVFTASNDGISTSRDYSTGNTATEIRFDGLIGAKYTLKAGYWKKAQWGFHRDALAQIAKLKDGEGQYIWRPSVIVSEPDRLLNLPINMSEYAPNTFTTGLYVGILGDFSYYWIVDSVAFQVQRLVERYAEYNQVGFIGRAEVDGMPVNENAFIRVKLA